MKRGKDYIVKSLFVFFILANFVHAGIVTSTADSGAGTLRQAILDATAGDIITFDNSIAGQTITINSSMAISQDLTIEGNSSNPMILDANSLQLFTASSGNFYLNNLTIQNSNHTSDGGAIRVEGANLFVNNTTFKNNFGGAGGAILASSGSVDVNNSHFDGNNQGLYTSGVAVKVENSSFINSTAAGIAMYEGYLDVKNSTFSDNNYGILVQITNTTGGKEANIENVVTSGNSYGIWSQAGPINLKNSAVADLIDGNNQTTGTITSLGNNVITGTISQITINPATGDNFDSGLDPQLGTLTQDSDGVTWAYPLTTGSPLIDAGSCTAIDASVITHDQFEDTRDDGSCDIGAREYVYVAPDITSGLIHHHQCENNFADEAANRTFYQDATVEYSSDAKIGQYSCSFNDDEVWDQFDGTGVDLLTDTGTVTFWIKAVDAAGTAVHIVDSGLSGGTLIHNDGTNNLKITSPSTNLSVPASSVMDNTWHHVAVVSDGTSTKVYVDGIVSTSASTPLEFSKGDAGVTNYVLSDTSGGGHANSLNGLMDDIRMYSRALSTVDVNELYNYSGEPKLSMKAHGGVLQFDNDRIETSAPVTTAVDNITMEGWFLWNGTDGSNMQLMRNGETAGYGVQWDRVATDQYRISLWSGGAISAYVDENISANQWYHIAVTRDSGTWHIYQDGIEKSLTFSVGSTTTTPSVPNTKTNIGATATYGEPLQGLADEVRIWNISRTQGEIYESMYNQLDGNESGLVAYYNFDERVGNGVFDLTGNGNDGTMQGDIQRVNFLGDTLEFDGVDDEISLGDIIEELGTFTVSSWVNPTTLNNDWNSILRKEFSDVLSVRNDGTVAVNLGNGIGWSSEVCQTTTAIPTNQWSHLAYSTDSSNDGVKIYINGNLEKICTNTTDSIGNNSNSRTIGAGFNFHGSMAEISMWNRALSENEIELLMSSSLRGDEIGLAGYWPLNEGHSVTARDYSFNTNDGTITGAIWTDTAPEIYGEVIYSDFGINTWQKLELENNSSTAAFTQTPANANISHFDPATGKFLYSSLSGEENITFGETSESLTLNIQTRSSTPVITGTTGSDNFSGTANDDILLGDSGNDTIYGLDGDDILEGGAGTDILDGGDGTDIAVFDGNRSNYTVVDSFNGTYTVTGIDGTDTLANIEYVSFDDELNLHIEDIASYLALKAHGGTMQFNGIDNNFIKTASEVTTATGTLTIEAWVYYPGTSATGYIFANGSNNTGYGVFIDSLGRVNGVMFGQMNYARGSLTAGTWNHIALVIDSANTAFVYVNGEQEGGSFAAYPNTPSGNFFIGIRPSGTEGYESLIDEVRVWNYDRYSDELNQTMHTQLDGNETGLLAYYNFDERLGDNIIDITGNGHDGVIDGNVSRINFLGNALEFDGVDDFVEVPYNATLNASSAITMMAWVKPTLDTNGTIFSKHYASNGSAAYSYELLLKEDGILEFGLDGITNADATSHMTQTTPIEADRYTHIAVTYDGSYMSIYLNGALDRTISASGSISTSTAPLLIGKRYITTDTRHFSGEIAESSIWSIALSEDEIQKAMHSSLIGEESGLIGAWKLNEGYGSSIYDMTLNSLDGTITGGAWIESAPEIMGNTIYTAFGVTTYNQLEVENGSGSATYAYTGGVPSHISFIAAGGVINHNALATDEIFNVTANDNGTNYSLDISVRSYFEGVTLNLTNINTSEHNITGIKLLGVGSIDGITVPLETVDFTDWYGAINVDGNYTVRISTDDGEVWWYNFTDGKIYDEKTTNDYRIELSSSVSSTISIDATTLNWENRVPVISGNYYYTSEVIAGTGTAGTATNSLDATSININQSWDVQVDNNGTVYVSEYSGYQPFIVKANGELNVTDSYGSNVPTGYVYGDNGESYVMFREGHIREISPDLSTVTTKLVYNNGLYITGDIMVSDSPYSFIKDGSYFYLGTESKGDIYKINGDTNVSVQIAGTGSRCMDYVNCPDGDVNSTSLGNIYGLALHPITGELYFVENTINLVRKLTSSGNIVTVAGNGIAATSGDGGLAINASLNQPFGIAFDSSGNLFISEYTGNVIRKIDTNGYISTVINSGLNNPRGIDIDTQGNIYTVNWTNPQVLKYTGFSAFDIGVEEGNSSTLINMSNFVSDMDGDVLTYSLSGTDAGDFNIDASGAITFIGTASYDYPADSDTNNIYEFTINVSDGRDTVSQNASIEVYGGSPTAITVTINFASAPSELTNVRVYAIDANRSGGFHTKYGGALDLNLSSGTTESMYLHPSVTDFYLMYELNSTDSIRSGLYSSSGSVYSLQNATSIDLVTAMSGVTLTIDSGNLVYGQLSGYNFLMGGIVFPLNQDGKDLMDIGGDINITGGYSFRVPSGNYTFKYIIKDNNTTHKDYYTSTGAVKLSTLADELAISADTQLNLTASTDAGTATLSYQSGWNLLSFPTKDRLDAVDLYALFEGKNVSHLVKYNPYSSWNYFWIDEDVATTEYPRFSEISSAEGFWLKANAADSIDLPLSGHESTYADEVGKISIGWNLIGMHVDKTVADVAYLVEAKGVTVDAIWVYRNGAWYVHYPHTTEITSTLSVSDVIKSTEGIWLKVK